MLGLTGRNLVDRPAAAAGRGCLQDILAPWRSAHIGRSRGLSTPLRLPSNRRRRAGIRRVLPSQQAAGELVP
jgi:hypothetical protein